MNDIIFVGLDVHKATVAVAVAEGVRGGEVVQLGTIPNRPEHIAKLAMKLGKSGRRVSFCYEAGPCGYGLYRQLTCLGHDCTVAAPSLIPMKAGDRVKTDRRDALMLAKLHRAGELTAVWVPDSAHEAMRDLIRSRATAVRVLAKARQHLQGFPERRSAVVERRGFRRADAASAGRAAARAGAAAAGQFRADRRTILTAARSPHRRNRPPRIRRRGGRLGSRQLVGEGRVDEGGRRGGRPRPSRPVWRHYFHSDHVSLAHSVHFG